MNKNRMRHGTGMGIGYVSIMIIFAVICLTVFAVLSFQSAYSAQKLTQRSTDYIVSYYAADSSAKRTLSRLDGIAAEAHRSGFFEDAFDEAELNSELGLENISARKVPEGVQVEYSARINDRQSLLVCVVFLSAPRTERYRIDRWQSALVGAEEEDEPLGVWGGE